MCGIAGIWYINNKPVADLSVIKKMTDSISHRGPDGEGHWMSDDTLLHLGHRRLSIIDLTDGGSQPMFFENKFVIVFNGEIYNYLEIKEILINKGFSFKSKSDTEVVLAAYKEWGINCIDQFDGMFAFAIYDITQKHLFCARDRFGEKPFYYTFYNGVLYFASEMKAMWTIGVPKNVNHLLSYNFFAHDLVEDPLNPTSTFYTNIFKLQPAHYFVYSGGANIEQKKYWDIDTSLTRDLSIDQASEQLMELLLNSVKRRSRSDVPIGTSLSGGLDSSTIVALISTLMPNNHTFSARFKDFSKDEGSYIDLIKNKFNTNHHNIFVDADSFIQELDRLVYHQEEPFQTGSIFAQYCVYKQAGESKISVMLDGQGADELLGGYDKDFRFYLRELIQSRLNTDAFLRQIKNNHLIDITPTYKEKIRHRYPVLYKSLSKVNRLLTNQKPVGLASEFYLQNKMNSSPFYEAEDLKTMLKYQLTIHGLGKLLKFADRNSMAHSVEVRLPFLNYELIEFVMSLSSSLFLHKGWSKAILREGVKHILPNEITYRKDKIGFEAPHTEWMKNKFLIEMKDDFKSKLIQNNIITAEYMDDWKIIIGAKSLYEL